MKWCKVVLAVTTVYAEVSNNFSAVRSLLQCKFIRYVYKQYVPLCELIPEASGVLSDVQECMNYLIFRGTNVLYHPCTLLGWSGVGNTRIRYHLCRSDTVLTIYIHTYIRVIGLIWVFPLFMLLYCYK